MDLEELKEKPGELLAAKLMKLHNASVDNVPGGNSFINRTQIGALITILRQRTREKHIKEGTGG